jgi:hypothetical protein
VRWMLDRVEVGRRIRTVGILGNFIDELAIGFE